MRKPAVIHHSIQLPFSGPPVLAVGARLNNTLCSTSRDYAHLSRELGDLDGAAVCTDHEVAAIEILVWQATIPALVARDIDPDMHSTRFAIELAANLGVHHLAVQHHHAHVAAVCAEHGLMEPVVGLVLDDIGYGSDGGSWGGELFWVDNDKFERLGHLQPLLMPGGEIAQREQWRLAAGVLHTLQRTNDIQRRYGGFPASVDLVSMLREGRNCPASSSAMMLMSAVAALLGLDAVGNPRVDAVQALEAAATSYFARNSNYSPVNELLWNIDQHHVHDLRPLLADIVDERDGRRGAATFHASLIAGATEWVSRACERSGARTAVLAGACLLDRLLAVGLRDNLSRRGIAVFETTKIAPDDSSVSLGQAWIALHAVKHI